MSDDNILKRITISLFGKDDGATKVLGDVDRRVDGLDSKLKTFGKITNIGAFRQFSDIAEGFDKSLGALGKLASGVAIVEVAGRTMKALGDGLSAVVDGTESFSEALDKVGSKIPVIGTMKEGFESLAVAIAKAEAAALGMDTAVAARRGWAAAKAATIFGFPSAVKDAFGEVSGSSDEEAKARAEDEKTRAIRARIEVNKRDEEESNRIARMSMDERQRIEADRDAALEKVLDRRREWAARNAGISASAEERFASDEQAIRSSADKKLAAIIEEGNAAIEKANLNRLRIQREHAEQLRQEQEATSKIFQRSERSRARVLGDLIEGPRGEMERLKLRSKQAIEDIQSEMAQAANDPSLTQKGFLNRIVALQFGVQTEQGNYDIQSKSMIDKRIKETNENIAVARSEQARIRAIETQQGPRTSTYDGRGVTGFFNQSKSIEDSGKKTADNTTKIADSMKTVADTINRIFTGGSFISL